MLIYAKVAKKRGLKIGGVLCRVTRGYFEVALGRMTGMKVTLRLVESTEDECLSSICFEPANQRK
ncbi:MAG: hypothetical protein WED04_08900 [Promethearchaeati archaeon SRVP18_Atabeyarchaeia-1]